MAADRIERFVLAAKAVAGARVDQGKRVAGDIGLHRVGIHHPVAHRARHGWLSITRRRRRRHGAGQWPPLLLPLSDAAVEQRDVLVPQPAQQPPQAYGDHAAGVVIDDDLRLRRDAGHPQLVGERLRIGQRMAAVAPVHR